MVHRRAREEKGRDWRMSPPPGVALLLLAVTSCGLIDPDRELVGCLPPYADVEQISVQQLGEYNVANAAVLVRAQGQTVCRLFFGSYGPTTQVPTASAAKWLSAAAILAVVDRGGLGAARAAADRGL